jgi:hypothetical protein
MKPSRSGRFKLLLCILLGILAVLLILFAVNRFDLGQNAEGGLTDIDTLLGEEDLIPPPPPIPASPQEIAIQPKDTSALGGYDVLIADRGNNRLIEVTPDKKIVWEYRFKGLPPGYGADDSFFTDGGKTVIVNLEKYHLIEQIDYQTQKIIWQYGTPGMHGSKPGFLFSPDDAYKLPSGDVMVADIKNCRVIEITPQKSIVRQYGKSRQCKSASGFLDAPNGDTPLPNGHILISTILDHAVLELDDQWHPIFSMSLPLTYPSDPQLTRAGNILVAEYKNPGKIVEISRQGQIMWEYDGEDGISLNKPSLAIELPNGNILANDDFNHRVIVIDKQTKKIIWQFGVTRKPDDGTTQLNIPDGIDIIMRKVAPSSSVQVPMVHSVGEVTRHAQPFIGQTVVIRGYLLKKEPGYSIFSDEPTGSISSFDLPVTGQGIDLMRPNQAYLIEGTFLDHGLAPVNGSAYHLELSALPRSTD